MTCMRRTVLLLALTLFLAACSKGGPATAPSPLPEAGGDQAVVIDRILAGLDGVVGDAQRILAKERRITPEVTDRLKAVYVGPELLNQIDAFRADVDNGLSGLKNPPGNRVTKVSQLITVSSICVFAQVLRDYGPATAGAAPPPASMYVILVTKDEADDPHELNPTPWALLYDGVQADGAQPEDVCRS